MPYLQHCAQNNLHILDFKMKSLSIQSYLFIHIMLVFIKLISQLGGVGSTVHPTASPLPLQRLQLEEFNGGSPMSQRSGADVQSFTCIQIKLRLLT